jgi:hypothetical protein
MYLGNSNKVLREANSMRHKGIIWVGGSGKPFAPRHTRHFKTVVAGIYTARISLQQL